MSEKRTEQNATKLEFLKKNSEKKSVAPQHSQNAGGKEGSDQTAITKIEPVIARPLEAAKRREEAIKKLENVIPAGRKPIPPEKKKKHQVPLYLTDAEYEYLEKLADLHFIKPARMLRIMIDQIHLFEKGQGA